MRRTNRSGMFCALAAAVMIATQYCSADPGPGGAEPPPDGPDAADAAPGITIAARVESFNLDEQRGALNGLILVDKGQRVQVNLPESIVDAVAKAVAVGDVIQATVVEDAGPGGPDRGGRGGPGGPDGRGGGRGGRSGPPDDGRGPTPPQEQPADHPVYRAQSIRDSHGQLYADTGRAGTETETIDDGIKALNYDRRGMLNGLQLMKGDFVHLPHEAADELDVRAGDRITVEGPARQIPGSTAKVIDARVINGNAVRGPGGPGGPGGPDGPGGADGPGAPPPPPDAGPDGPGGPPPPDAGPDGPGGPEGPEDVAGPGNAAENAPPPPDDAPDMAQPQGAFAPDPDAEPPPDGDMQGPPPPPDDGPDAGPPDDDADQQ